MENERKKRGKLMEKNEGSGWKKNEKNEGNGWKMNKKTKEIDGKLTKNQLNNFFEQLKNNHTNRSIMNDLRTK